MYHFIGLIVPKSSSFKVLFSSPSVCYHEGELFQENVLCNDSVLLTTAPPPTLCFVGHYSQIHPFSDSVP